MFRPLAEPFVFYARVAWRALRDTWRHILAQVAVSAIIFVLASWAKCVSLPKGTACSVNDLQSGLVGVGIWLGAVLAFNLVMAPVRIHREQGARIHEPDGARRVRLVSDPVATPGSGSGYFAARWRFHIAQTKDGVMLMCQEWQTVVPSSIECWVEDPKGNKHQGALHKGDSAMRTVYPEDFGVEPESGPHFALWRMARADYGLLAPEDRAQEIIVAHDPLDFTIEVL